jgi:hypothetical protein
VKHVEIRSGSVGRCRWAGSAAEVEMDERWLSVDEIAECLGVS